jgi:hypothetical protein
MLLKSRCRQLLRQRICHHLSALHQLDDAIFDELVDEWLTRVKRDCSPPSDDFLIVNKNPSLSSAYLTL